MPRSAIVAGVAIVILAAGLLVSLREPAGDNNQDRSTSTSPGARHVLLDEVVFTRELAKGQMTELIASGSHQVAGKDVSDVTSFRRIRTSDNIDYDTSYGSSAELTFNVAGPEFAGGAINPFHRPKIREAFNWLVDRQYVAEEIYGGLAVPRLLAINTTLPDSARLASTVRRLEVQYGHNPERAKRVITRELIDAGAEKTEGTWYYDGKPLVIKVLIRIEDQRRLVGDYIADLLQDMGFRVDRMYRSAGEATRLWIAGDPSAGDWHIYTGGWVTNLVSRDLATNFNYYYTPRGRPNPLWQAYRPAPEFDEITDRLARRQYKSWEERQSLMRRALELSLEDSARVWLIDQISAWPRSPDVSLAVDLAAGTASSSLWAYTLRYADRYGGSMKIALPGLLADPYNLIAGTNWTFDLMVIRGMSDAPVFPDPFTGLYMPQQLERAEVFVNRHLVVNRTLDWIDLTRTDEIDVPPDTWIDWDSKNERWITVGENHPDGLKADTLVRITYEKDFLERQWHDGSRRSVADIVLHWILTFERADPESSMYDSALAPAFAPFKKDFRGYRIISLDPLVLEIYGGPVYPDAELLVATRSPGFRGTSGIVDMSVPWHTLGLAIRAESQGELALSSTKADKNRVEWTNFVDGPSLEVMERHLRHAASTGYLPYSNVLGEFVDAGDIESRYQALTEWYEARGHFWVADGPYYLHAVHAIEGSVVLRASPFYTGAIDKWLRFDKPRIPAFEIAGPMVIRQGTAARFDLDIRFDGKGYPAEDIDSVAWLLFNGQRELVSTGDAQHVEGGHWRVDLDADQVHALGTGGNQLDIAVTAKPVALPTFGSHGFATVPADAMTDEIAHSGDD